MQTTFSSRNCYIDKKNDRGASFLEKGIYCKSEPGYVYPGIANFSKIDTHFRYRNNR